MSAESFIRTAKASYAKNKASPSGSGTSDTMGSQAQITRKRTKDTSGPEASPHTSQCRPVAKRLTPERPGRRLTYPDCHNCKGNIKHNVSHLMLATNATVTVAVVASIGTPGGIKALRSFSAPNEGRKSLLLYSGNIELFFIFTQATYHLKTQCASSTATATMLTDRGGQTRNCLHKVSVPRMASGALYRS